MPSMNDNGLIKKATNESREILWVDLIDRENLSERCWINKFELSV